MTPPNRNMHVCWPAKPLAGAGSRKPLVRQAMSSYKDLKTLGLLHGSCLACCGSLAKSLYLSGPASSIHSHLAKIHSNS